MKKMFLIVILIIFLPAYCFAQAGCYQEGERFMEDMAEEYCCVGLVKAHDCVPSEPIGIPDSCGCPLCKCYICIDCGNGICGLGENWCNCAADCPRPPEVYCTEDIQCGYNSCQQGRNRCMEIYHKCIAGECITSVQEYENHSCARYYSDSGITYPDSAKCLDSCGDGICHTPETRNWCPEDCECLGDFDDDGDVDGSDLIIFAINFGKVDCLKPNMQPCEGDFNLDGTIDGSDLVKFAAGFGRTDCPIP